MAGSTIVAGRMSQARVSTTAVPASSTMASSATVTSSATPGPCNKLLTDERNTKKGKGDNTKELYKVLGSHR